MASVGGIMVGKANNRDISEKTDVKIFILFLLDNIGYPLDEETLSEIILENGYVGYFDFAECFSELTDEGHIVSADALGKSYYAISDLGHAIASELQGGILAPIREKSLRSALRILSFKKKNATLHSDVYETDEKKFCVRCRICESGRDALDVSLTLDTKEKAEQVKRNFLENPEEVYRGIMAVLSGQIDYYLK